MVHKINGASLKTKMSILCCYCGINPRLQHGFNYIENT